MRQCLTTGGNSMKRQSQLVHDVKGDTMQTAIENYEGTTEPIAVKTGWGTAYIPGKHKAVTHTGVNASQHEPKFTHHLRHKFFMHKSALPTWQDNDNFDRASEAAATSHPMVVFNHIRETHVKKYNALQKPENAHPFQVGDWMIMQHGDFPPGIIRVLDVLLARWRKQDPGSPVPESDVDTERIACYIGARFRQKYGTVNIGKLCTEQVRHDYGQFMGEIIRNPAPEIDAAKGNHGTYNLILTDGERMFATNYSATKELFLGLHESRNGHQESVLTTDKIQPLASSGLSPIEWQTVPKNSVISIERTSHDPHLLYQREPFLPDLPPERTAV